MEQVREFLPLLIPIFVIQLVLIAVALADLLRREHTRGPKWLWAIIIVFVNLIGPILYLVAGREE